MLSDTQLKNRRDEILLEMQSIRRMLRGTVTMQTFSRTAADGSTRSFGPYALFQRWHGGKNRPQRVPKEDIPAVQDAVDGYQRFRALAEEFATLTETLTQRSGPLLPSKKNFSRRRAPRSSRKPRAFSKAPSSA
jgi:hypothetical protein